MDTSEGDGVCVAGHFRLKEEVNRVRCKVAFEGGLFAKMGVSFSSRGGLFQLE